MKMSSLIAVPFLALIAAPGDLRAETVAVPEGCTAVATVLKSLCQATTIFECGASREAHTFRDGEPTVVHVYTPDWKMTEFRFAGFSGASMTAVPGTVANTRLEELLDTGTSEEAGDFVMNTRMIKDRPYTMSGRIEMAEDEPELGGAVFKKARMFRLFELKPGAGGMEFEIDLYISGDPDVFIEGSWTRSVSGSEKEMFDQTPYDVVWPGEENFMAVRSEQGCE